MENYFETLITPCIQNFQKVKIPSFQIDRIHQFIAAVLEAKKQETHHQKDGGQAHKRFFTGTLGEAALEELLQIEIIDWRVGDSRRFDTADLNPHGLDVGIKTVEYGKFPIVHKTVKRPEIINFKLSENEVWVGGLASVEVLQRYQDDGLVLSPLLRQRGTKTGFFGFQHLAAFKTLKELKSLVGQS